MGGAEFADTKPIRRNDIPATLDYVSRIAKIPVGDLIVLGSGGKKERSGDLDIAVDPGKHDEWEVHQRIEKKLGEDRALYRAGFKTHAFSVPIAGDGRKGRVQLDLKFNNVEFLKFSHFSAGERSKYKGAVRTLLLATLSKKMYDEKRGDSKHFVGDEFVLGVNFGLDANSGYKRMFRMRKPKHTPWRTFRREAANGGAAEVFSIRRTGKSYQIRSGREGRELTEKAPITPGPRGKRGSGSYVGVVESCKQAVEAKIARVMKNGFEEQFEYGAWKNVTPAEVRAVYPDFEFKDREESVADPGRIVRRLFGRGTNVEDVETAEQVIELIRARHPRIAESVFRSLRWQLKEMGMPVPDELAEQRSAPAASGGELAADSLPSLATGWQELQRAPKGSGKPYVWGIRQDRDSFYLRQGRVGGKLRESGPFTPGPRGEPGQKGYVDPVETCRREVGRRIARKQADGYAAPGGPAAAGEVDFDNPLPKSFRAPKPVNQVDPEKLKELHEAGRTRYTRKYDGSSHILVHHSYGWEIYSIEMNCVTEKYPEQLKALERSDYGVGSILQAEAVCFDEQRNDDFQALNRFVANGVEEARELVAAGGVPEPTFVVFDILYHNGRELSDCSYDERCALWKGEYDQERGQWRQLPAAAEAAGDDLLVSADFFDVTPDNWEQELKRFGYEGWVVVDGAMVPGEKLFTLNGRNPRSAGNYKLVPLKNEDVVLYAVRYDEKGIHSFFSKQRYPDTYPGTDTPHPKAGQWFACGEIPVQNRRDVGESFAEAIESGRLIEVHSKSVGQKLPLDEDLGGVVAVVLFRDRYASDKFRIAKFPKPVRIRADKSADGCIAHRLGSDSEESSNAK